MQLGCLGLVVDEAGMRHCDSDLLLVLPSQELPLRILRARGHD